MPRLGKRKRDALRLATEDELLFDRLAAEPWGTGSWYEPITVPMRARLESDFSSLKSLLAKSTVVLATNVSDYFFQECDRRPEKVAWDARRDFPCCVPPHDPLFVECRDNSRARGIPPRWGWLFTTADPDGRNYETTPGFDAFKIVIGILFFETPDKKNLSGPAHILDFAVDREGNMSGIKSGLYTPAADGCRERVSQHGELATYFDSWIPSGLLTLSFMNCKNVNVSVVRPNQEVDRARKRRGERPLVRYNIIDIEPMKQILRSEGDIGSNGLKRALHICRGHFARLTRNWKGELLDKPTTYYREAHVRGSIDKGVVVSDYNVHPPAAPPDGPANPG